MKVNIQSKNFTLTDAIQVYIKRRLNFAFSRREEYIQLVRVRLSDTNGPRGGKDKCCHIQILIPHVHDIVIKNIEVDLYAAIDKAIDRAGQTIGRRLTRHRDKQRLLYRKRLPLFSDIKELPYEEECLQ